MKHTVLVVDDEATQRELLTHVLKEKLGYKVVAVSGGMAAIDYVLSGQQPVPDAVLLDLSMPEVDGMQVIRTLRPLCPELPIVVLTVYGSLENAVAAVRAGAVDFLSKPVSQERLAVSLQNARRMQHLFDEVKQLKRHVQPRVSFSDMVGQSPAYDRALTLSRRVAASVELPVMIIGENGTGKRMLAHAIHEASPIHEKPWVAMPCNLLEGSRGWEAVFGTYTVGAVPEMLSRGLLADAHGSTLLIEHPEQLSIPLQHGIIHALQQARVQGPHAYQPQALNTRVIATISAPLDELVSEGKMHASWRDVLGKAAILMPPLRSRGQDVLQIANTLIEKFGLLEQKFIHGISEEAKDWLLEHPWPGNVRQLSHVLHRAVVLCTQDILSMDDLKGNAHILPYQPTSTTSQTNANSDALPLVEHTGSIRPLADIEAEAIRFALQKCEGRITRAARELGIGRSTLYRKLNEMGE